MAHRYIKVTLTAVVLVLAFAGMMWTTLREGTEYYKNIDEVLPQAQQWQGKKLQLHGYVVPGSIKRRRDPAGNITLDYIFKVQNNPARASGDSGGAVDASYTGIVPDTFKDEAEVVLKGKLTPTGFHTDPNGVMAKCPSKYEEKAKLSATSGT
jgi:cytochrome c-type biogenesis protein CcmE